MRSIITLFALATILLFSCSPENEDYIQNDTVENFEIIIIDGGVTGDPTATSSQTDLMAGQNLFSGIVTVDVVDGNVQVTYSTDPDWVIKKTHLYIGEFNNIPTEGNGNPQNGQFPYKGTHNQVSEVVYIGPAISQGECTFVAAHAEVLNIVTGQSQTAWGSGIPIGGDGWAMAFEYCY